MSEARAPRGHSLAWRLALAFALTSALVLSAIGVLMYRSLLGEIAYRDDLALMGRLEQVRALLHNSDSLDALRERPGLYQNMLGNQDGLLRVSRADGRAVIDINPRQQRFPDPAPLGLDIAPSRADVLDARTAAGVPVLVLAGRTQGPGGEALQVMVGRLLDERETMLARYRGWLYLAVALGTLAAFGLGLLLLRQALRPLRQVAASVAAIGLRNLDRRVQLANTPRELREPVQALNGMLERLQESFARLSQFSADLAHEIRTPLHNLLVTNGQALTQARDAEVYQELLAANIDEYERLGRMVENLLFLARADHGERRVHAEPIDLAALGDDLCDYFEALAADRQLCLVNRMHGTLLADRQLLQRALGNLLANAVRHADPGSQVSLALRADDASAGCLVVSNQGPAIAVEHQPRLFDRFYRVDPSRAAPGDSGGLGLAIVQSIMALHGGQARLHSDGTVTEFLLVFPPSGALSNTQS